MLDQLAAAWYFHIPNYALAILVWTLIGRFVLGLFVPADWDNYIWRFFRLMTDWVLRLVRHVTPAAVAPLLMPLVAAFWLSAARAALVLLLLVPASA